MDSSGAGAGGASIPKSFDLSISGKIADN